VCPGHDVKPHAHRVKLGYMEQGVNERSGLWLCVGKDEFVIIMI